MLVSEENIIGSKLHERISAVLPIKVVSPASVISGHTDLLTISPPVIFVNQLDVNADESQILSSLHSQFPETKIIALHTHTAPGLKSRTLNAGYDGYLSLFELGEKLSRLLNSLGVEASRQ